MPQIWEKDRDKVGVALSELIPAWFPSYPSLKMNIQRTKKEDYGIKRLQRGCLNNDVLIDFDTLPREIQVALGDPRKCAHIMEKWYKTDAEAVRFYPDYKFENMDRLSGKHQEEYIINANVLRAIKAYREAHETELSRKGKKVKKIYEFMTNECQKFNETLKAKYGGIQHTLQSSERRFRETYDKFFTSTGEWTANYASLIDGKLQNTNALIMTDKVTALLDSMFARSGGKPNKLKVARQYQLFKEGIIKIIIKDTAELFNPEDFKQLSDRSITKWLSTWESKTGTYTLRSADRQRDLSNFSVANERERPLYAGSLISVDDRQPPFEYGPSQRLWLYNCLDVASDAITATVWGKSKEGMILDFYRQIVRNYTEWGFRMPYELEAESSLNSSYKDTFLRDGALFGEVRLEANNARSKIIENRNRQFRLVLEKDMEGWKGRPFAKDESNQALPKDTIYAEAKYRSYDSLVTQSLMVIEDWNNMPHPTRPELSRWDYFVEMQNPQLHPTNWLAFMPSLGYKTPTSCNVGKIQVQGVKCMLGDAGEIFFAESLINLLKKIEGEDVSVYWLDGNDGKLLKALVYVGDTYICEAIPTPKYNHAAIERTAQCEINMQIQAKYTATVDAYVKGRKRSIEQVTIIDERPITLNRNFKMPGINRYVASEDEAAVLPDTDDYQYNTNANTPQRSLLKNF